MSARILVVDDDRAVRSVLEVHLGKLGHGTILARDTAEARRILASERPDLVITDVRMPDGTGLDLLDAVRAQMTDVPVLVMTGFGSVTDAVRAMKAGAEDYLIKPIERDALQIVVERALERRAQRVELDSLRRRVADRFGFERLVGSTAAMRELTDTLAAVADTSATVLLMGPTGTGKELLAQALHQRSSRNKGPFVALNCGSVPETLLESELFGHERGAFTGAMRQHAGRFEQAHGGTLLLDEIGDIGPAMQVRLLRVLQDGEIQRVGGSTPLHVDVRIVAATHKDLRAEVLAGRFRSDLFYRLNVVSLRVPSLAERAADIPLLAEHFIRRAAERGGRPPPPLTDEVVKQLMAHSWPGNVRELEHAMERAVILGRGDQLAPLVLQEALSAAPTPSATPDGQTLQQALRAAERQILEAALQGAGGVAAEAARRLGLSRSNLSYRMGRLGMGTTASGRKVP